MTPAPTSLDLLAERLGHRFEDPELLARALSHRSWCSENPGHPSNERLEFLGDAVLGWLVAELAYHRYDEFTEGDLTNLRKSVVNADALANAAREIDLGAFVRLGNGEAAAGGADKPSILSDAFEAVLGALYLDGGEPAARQLVTQLIAPKFGRESERLDELDYKTQLQELAAGSSLGPPKYRVESTGPDHDKWFTARVLVGGDVRGTGEGSSKKRAEQQAAAEACASWPDDGA